MNADAAPATLIRHKRDGATLTRAALDQVARGIASGAWGDGQVAAFAMAVAWRGMGAAECRDFTFALRDSGRQLHWPDLPGPVLDKHSTGGVGDGVSLILAPLVAACGGFMPMISGRGLGHTGGTLDKLESIPGYDVNPAAEQLQRVVAGIGCAIVGQGPDLVPADQRLYAVRDVTATVDVPELIIASILSKKLAGGAQAMVLDVKTGNGAQLTSLRAAGDLAERMLEVARDTGLRLSVAMSDMRQVLGREAGNALEVWAALDVLCGRRHDGRLRELSLSLASELLLLGGLARDREEADARLQRALESGAAAERFQRMVAALGGPADLLERPVQHLPSAPLQREVRAESDGYVGMIDVRALGQAVVQLGGGRERPDAAIDPAVGLSAIVGRGEYVERGQALAVVHARSEQALERAAAQVQEAITLSGTAPAPEPLLQWYAAPEPVA